MVDVGVEEGWTTCRDRLVNRLKKAGDGTSGLRMDEFDVILDLVTPNVGRGGDGGNLFLGNSWVEISYRPFLPFNFLENFKFKNF